MQHNHLSPLNTIAFIGKAKKWGSLIEQEAKEWTKKRGGIKPPKKKFGKYKILLFHFYVLYFLVFVLIISCLAFF